MAGHENLPLWVEDLTVAYPIGHPFAETSRAIRHFLKGLKETEFELVHLSAVLSPAGS